MNLSDLPRIKGPLRYVGYIGVLIMVGGLAVFAIAIVSMIANFDPDNPPTVPTSAIYGFGAAFVGAILVTVALALGEKESEHGVDGVVVFGDVIHDVRGPVISKPVGSRHDNITQQRIYVDRIEAAVKSLPLSTFTRREAEAAIDDVRQAVQKQNQPETANALVRLTSILNETGVLASSADPASRAIVGLAQTLGGYAQSLVQWFSSDGDVIGELRANIATRPSAPRRAAVDENVQFTVYRPRTIRPTLWYSLVAFAHLSERRPDAPGEPDPIQEVDRQARQTLGEQFAGFAKLTEDFVSSIPREGELTLIPSATGITFNPRSRSFIWSESVHREEFRLQADLGTVGTTVRGRLSVYSGALLVADVGLSFRVVAEAIPEAPIDQGVDHLRRYRNIFASYSHKDIAIARLFEQYASLQGDRYLRDWVDLRAGQRWRDELKRMIRDADVFQLLWSSNAMRSDYVREEYEYALSLGRPEFVRPTYWEHPLPKDAAAGLPPEELLALHFQRFDVSSLRGSTATDRPAEAAPARRGGPSRRVTEIPPDARAESPGIDCAVCGALNGASDVFCRSCGTFLEFESERSADSAPGWSAPPTLPDPQPEAAEMGRAPAARPPADVGATVNPSPASQPVEARVAQAGDLICSNCGEVNDPTRRFCRRCANELRSAPPPMAAAPARASRPMLLLPALLLIGLLVLGILGTFALFGPPPR